MEYTIVSLSEQPEYEALYYVVALRGLANPTARRVVWIDAIWINQSDDGRDIQGVPGSHPLARRGAERPLRQGRSLLSAVVHANC